MVAIRGEEIGFLLGFNFVFIPELIKQACSSIKGREVFWVFNIDDPNAFDKIDKQIETTVIEGMSNTIDQYPFDRVVQNIYDGSIEDLRVKLVEDVNIRLKKYECKVQIIKRNDTVLSEKFNFVGVWKNFSEKVLSVEDIDDIFSLISSISYTSGLIAERPDDFESGFFSLRQMV